MRPIYMGVAGVLFLGLGSAAQADSSHTAALNNEASHGLSFAELEFAMPRDPGLWSSDPRWGPRHTPARILVGASDALHAAIPDETPVADAAAQMRKAGAKCAVVRVTVLECRYNDVEIPFGRGWDNVTWCIKLALTDGKVSGIAVSRDWTRR